MKNIVDAIVTLIARNDFNLTAARGSHNRANSQGDALEDYVKNLFADTFDLSETECLNKWSETFSWLGNSSNPPDLMLKGGDAVEVKKIESPDAAIALNSSPPKHTLKNSSPLISRACREAEDWAEKEIIYTVGVVNGNSLKHLCMVYGRDYCASEECYSRIRQKIKDGVETIPFVNFAPTRELGRVNCVDPLGITYLRIRGMWHIENPWRVFGYAYQRNLKADFNFMCVIDSGMWTTLENREELIKLQKDYPTLQIIDTQIKSPDNPCKLRNAKLIRYEVWR